MISSVLFARYARALADVVMENHEEEVVTKDLNTYREIFKTVPDLLEVFHSPGIPRAAKEKVLSELMTRYPVSKTTGNFLRVLLQHNRIRYFQEVFDYYLRTVNERKGIVAAQVEVAAPLSEQDRMRLQDSLSRAIGKIVTLHIRTDPELLGGLIVQVGSTVYDGSIRRQLWEMKRRLAELG